MRHVESNVCWVIDRVVGERGPTNGSYPLPTHPVLMWGTAPVVSLLPHIWGQGLLAFESGAKPLWQAFIDPSLGLDTWHDMLNL